MSGDIMKNEKGNISLILSVVMIGIFGFMAFVADIGIVYAEKTKLTNAIDAAVLAAGLELPKGQSIAIAVAEEYLQLNGVELSETNIVISPDNKSISISATRDVNHIFAVAFGSDQTSVTVSNKAIIAPAKSVKGGIRPIGVEKFDFTFGQLVTLKEAAGDGYNGNYGAIALGGTGSSIFLDNLLYGYDGVLTIGDTIPTETGVMANVINDTMEYINSHPSTYLNYDRNSPRLWTVPLVDNIDLNGRDYTTIVGFAQFFVENIGKQSGKMTIDGRFIHYAANGEIDLSQDDYGIYAVKLVK